MNLGQQVGGQQAVANPMFPGDCARQRHVEAYQQVLDPQPVHRQDADAYWAGKIAEVMRDQFGIKPVIGLAEWVKNKKPMSCPFGHKEPEMFAFDTTKADRIFDFLL